MGIHNIADKLQLGEFPVGTATPTKMMKTSDGYQLAYGTVVPADATSGYAPGCLFQHTDGGNATALYVNEGTEASCDFNPIVTDVPADNIEVLAATEVLVAADSGKTLFLAHATEFDVKLPAPAAGLRFKFIVGLAPSGANYTITTNGTTQNVIHGIISSAEDAAGAGAQTNGTPVDVVTFVASKAQIGDWVELTCDGTLWYLQGACVQQDAITLA